jgi:two-component system, OmpR family, phosphate regulon response regulator PhoB
MQPKEILVVEDELPIRQMIVFGLRRSGFALVEAEDAGAAMAALHHRMGGLQLVRQLKSDRHTQTLPIIMLTARAAEADKIATLESGADDYLTKPFSPIGSGRQHVHRRPNR